ncbi:MFS transporter [Streptomyces sp. NPDC001594]|uniref:MFS transporter n=1 Tax=Streptomyces sp. NPDC001594 TaxID=3364590 RepID=UPI00368D7464
MSIASGTRAGARWALVAVLAANMLVDALEVSATLVALPAVGSGLGASVTRVQWIVTGFAAGFAGAVLLGGRLVEWFGRRRVFLVALLVFAAASMGGPLADRLDLLVATRVVKGFCVALTAPTGLAIIVASVPEGGARRRAVSVYTLFGAAGFCSGLLLSGLLTGAAGWRWTLAFPAPLALLLFAVALRVVPREPAVSGGGARWQAVVAGGALTSAVLLLVDALARRWWGGVLAAAAAALVFVRAERASPRPLVHAVLLRHGPLVRSALGAAALNGSYVGFLLVAALDLRRGGWSAWETALGFLPAGAPLALTALHSGRIAARLGPARAVAAGALSAPAGYALYPRSGAGGVTYVELLPSLSLVGLAFVLAFTALHLQATGSLPSGLQAAAGGLYQTCVQLGAALTPALASALYAASGRSAALWLVTAVGLAGAGVALAGLAHPSTDPS